MIYSKLSSLETTLFYLFNLNFLTFMKLQVHSIHFDADRKLITYIQKKLDKLETFYDRMVDGEVFLRLNNEGIENKTVEIKLRVPGTQLFATEKAKSFEEATGLAAEALRNQLKKFKTRVYNGRS
jgi:putative sigma-54 modulation protein